MKTVSDHIRSHLLTGVVNTPKPKLQQIAQERVYRLFGKQFKFIINEAKARIRMGTFRYENSNEKPWPVMAKLGLVPSYMDKLKEKQHLYLATKNQEYLVDILNYVLLEFTDPCEEDVYYESTEREEKC